MMKDAMEGKLDYIVTKSISRFARNTIDFLTCTRELRQLKTPVGVYFEKENIDTLDAKGELILTILSALEQDKSDVAQIAVEMLREVNGERVVETMSPEFVGFIQDAYRSLKFAR